MKARTGVGCGVGRSSCPIKVKMESGFWGGAMPLPRKITYSFWNNEFEFGAVQCY